MAIAFPLFRGDMIARKVGFVRLLGIFLNCQLYLTLCLEHLTLSAMAESHLGSL
jgi:hypothetical protein